MSDQLRNQQIEALLRERSQYQRNLDAAKDRGDQADVAKWTDRIRVVDNSLTASGHDMRPQHKVAEKRGPGRPRKPAKSAEVSEESEADGPA